MYWENPGLLLGFWILPVLAGLLVYAHRKRMAAARGFVDQAMVDRLLPASLAVRHWIKAGLLLLGIGCLIAAAARPRFGVYFEEVSTRGADLFVLIDVSRSMQAEDIAPNRLERAKSDVKDLLKKLQGDRVGLIAFAGAAVVKVPLTTDRGFFLAVLDEIDTASAPRGGSLIGDAIRKAIEAMGDRRDRDRAIILITDGEDHDSFPEEAAGQAAEQGIKIFSVGLGDPKEGTRIPVRDDDGRLHYVQYQGQEVWSKMDERLLKEIALATGGAYIPARTRVYDLGQVYEDHLAGLTRGKMRSQRRKRYRERFQLFVCLGVILLLAEQLVPAYARRETPPAAGETAP